METLNIKPVSFVFIALILLAVLLSGIVLSRKGRPLHAIIFGAHKIVSVALLIWLGILLFNYFKSIGFQLSDQAAPLVLAASFVLAFVSGALLSIDKIQNSFFLWMHRIASALIVISGLICFIG
jgi:hypothetical protein